ncbi:ArgP/LysG family DNA-binding transcriptional regulator [Nocardioides sp.]|jgi:LysR family transcriptional regulator (chromosome initiation inhibitor)|uniref:ArgP/LysG family DNA-binding transcriptional regulator n=1 Tax=Nocardioides sp. TaxID=35761 RepID=UPI002B9CF8FD|nr:ArgP/LysG family DNA-binding transcriptional regulator [Nocardioides sp.]HVX56005.1 ArgP/LysG family DNA-binding transcriptional regulator [Nocardioides sp.]
MRFDPAQLETLVTITEEGTFEAAARRLHLTPSAVSQRIRALERTAGQVLVRRATPSVATPAGEPLVRLGRQMRLLAAEAAAALGAAEVVELAVAVNADSLATWFRPVLDAVAARPSTALRLHVEDQVYSHDLLRRGEVLAAVSSEAEPVQGCAVEPLGGLRYTPAATPALVERHRRGRGVDWSALPMVVFNEKDHLQDDLLAAHGAARPPVVHRVPSTADFHQAVRRGLGWGMLLDEQLEPDLAEGRVVRMPGARPVVVRLFWHRWRLDSTALDGLSADVRAAAGALAQI